MSKPLVFVVLLVNFIVAQDVGEPCKLSNGLSSKCVLNYKCDAALRQIRKHNKHFFNRCGFSGEYEIICCPPDGMSKSPNQPQTTPITLTEGRLGKNESLRISDRECKKLADSIIPPLGLHIIGGEEASLGEFPHMAALGYDTIDGIDFKCGGSLISVNFIVTAAHCVENLDGFKPTFARLGVVEIGERAFNPNTDIKISEIITHPKYDVVEKYNDIALLKLQSPVRFSMNVNAVCLYNNNEDPAIALTVTGWGRMSVEKDVRSSMLLKANVSAVAAARCAPHYANWRKLPAGIAERQLCAGDPQGAHDACQGDSGGPLQAITSVDGLYRLIGITSFGRGCGSIVPGVYTRISRYLDWIESKVWPN